MTPAEKGVIIVQRPERPTKLVEDLERTWDERIEEQKRKIHRELAEVSATTQAEVDLARQDYERKYETFERAKEQYEKALEDLRVAETRLRAAMKAHDASVRNLEKEGEKTIRKMEKAKRQELRELNRRKKAEEGDG
ncbi:MAG: hypothetical protein Kow0069_10770 [Promethearchaeota archaeon]